MKIWKHLNILALGLVLTACASSPTNNANPTIVDPSRQFDKATGKLAQNAQNAAAKGKFTEAIRLLKNARNVPGLTPYEDSTLLSMLATYSYELNDIPASINYYEKSIAAGGLKTSEIKLYQSQIFKLHYLHGNKQQAVSAGTQWLNRYGYDDEINQIVIQELFLAEKFKEALPLMEQRMAQSKNLNPSDYILAAYIYQRVQKPEERYRVLDELVRKWPDDKSHWNHKIAALHALNKKQDVLRQYELMYERGLLTTESDIKTLARLRRKNGDEKGAKALMEKEYINGRVSNTEIPAYTAAGQYGLVPVFEIPKQ